MPAKTAENMLAHPDRIFELDDAPPPAMFETMFRALERETALAIGPLSLRPLALPLRDAEGAVAGGLWGTTLYEWLAIQLLIVPTPLRRRGIGAALVRGAEAAAVARGCRGVFVDTFDFQAEGFYRRLGYERFGVLEDFPPGHRRIFLSKSLGATK